MSEIQKLKIDISNTKGWDNSGGKSNNVWGEVPFPEEIIKIANDSKVKSKKLSKLMGKEVRYLPCIWTAYDKIMYADDSPVSKKDLPSTISATFKSCYNRYGAIVENMAMRIAFALDLPTSYNYIVRFEPSEYPKIVENYPNPTLKNTVNKLGIVSIDFLQSARSGGNKEVYTDLDENGNEIEVECFCDINGDKLIPFDDMVVKIVGNNKLSGDQNLIENWVSAVDLFVEEQLKKSPREKINKIINNVHSRIARSFLLKEFCGDCDNTSYNSTVVFNETHGTLVYGPNHDFGDSFNKLVKTKIDRSQVMSMEDINKLPEFVRVKMLERLKKEDKESVADIARQYSVVGASERNIGYILANFPDSAKEFFDSVNRCVREGSFNKIVDSYTHMTCDGKAIMTEEEANIFKEYLTYRAEWMSGLYNNYLKQYNNNSNGETLEDYL